MNQFSMDMADCNFVPFVRLLRSAARLSRRAISVDEPLKRPRGMSIASEVLCT